MQRFRLRRQALSGAKLLCGSWKAKCSEISIRNSLVDSAGDAFKAKVSKYGPLTWYSCGPTVYDSSHLGHARTYVCTDIIRRILSDFFNVRLSYAMGITDIDDKIIAKAKSLGYNDWTQMRSLVRQLENDFFRDMDRLNVQRPDSVLRVTEHIPDILGYIQQLIDKGSAYVTQDGVYFNFSSLSNEYDKFGCANVASSEEEQSSPGEEAAGSGAAYQSSSAQHHKRSARDFALWKLHSHSKDSSAKKETFVWDSPWGAGRPGWHIECSAMTHALFGAHIDIHSGGVDLKFPHHTNEIAQCEAHNCSAHNAWVDTWIHLGHLHIEGRKMSKSLKNFISIDDYLRAQLTTAPADDFRLYCLQHKYHATLTYSISRVEEAAKLRGRFENFFSSVRTALNTCNIPARAGQVWCEDVRRRSTPESSKLSALLSVTQEQVRVALGDDFNTPVVLNALSTLVGEALPYANLVLAAPAESAQGLAIPLRAQPIEPLISVSAYVARILTLLGLQFPTSSVSVISALVGDGVPGTGGDAPAAGASPEAVDTVVQFRSTVRTSALQGIKALRTKKKAGVLTELEVQLEAQLQEILQASDASREGLGKSFGIKIEDLGGTSKWTKV